MVFQSWPDLPNESQIASARAAVLKDPRFFCVCRLCGETNARGHTIMLDGCVCMSCAEKRLGVLF